MGRKRSAGLRRPNGRLSEAKGARPAHDDAVKEQPHRKPFAALLGEAAAGSYAASFALGRARLLGEAEDLHGPDAVRAALRLTPGGPDLGISERLFFAGMRYAADVGRERWVRAAPKDKPSAMAFMQARGINLNAHEVTAAEARKYAVAFEEATAALMAAPCSQDVRSVMRTLRQKARELGAHEMVGLLRGVGALMNPQASANVKRMVEKLVIDDRDLDPADLEIARSGLAVLADHYYGREREDTREIRGSVMERPLWLQKDFKAVEFMYQHYDGTPRRAGEPEKEEPRSRSKGGWKERHRNVRG